MHLKPTIPLPSVVLLCLAVCNSAAQSPTWFPKFGSPSGRHDLAMAYDPGRRQVVLFGGFDGAERNDTWIWDGTNWELKNPVNRPPVRMLHALAFDPNRQRVVLFGGISGSSYLIDTWEWNGDDWTQMSPAHAPPGRQQSAMAFHDSSGRVVLFGGYNGSLAVKYLNDTWVWDGTDWVQQSPATSPPARRWHALAGNSVANQVVLFGGATSAQYLDDTWIWTGANWIQMSVAAPPGRGAHALAYDSSHSQVVLFGGYNNATGRLDDTWVWNGAAWTQKSPAAKPAARDRMGMAYDAARAQVVIFGGWEERADTWVWNGSNWTQKTALPGPPVRNSHAMAYDAARGQVLLFDGYNLDTFRNDTWVWDGFSWTQKSPAVTPPPRYSHAMAYDVARGQTVLFGGWNGIEKGDTWVWDGSNWAQRTPAVSPSIRSLHAMAYDAIRAQVLLFGGDSNVTRWGDTWVWDGSAWTQKSPAASPPARQSHAMAYDAARGQVVLFGGSGNTGPLGDTWVWDGSNWTQKNPAASPSARHGHAMAYDAARGKVVLFGGGGATASLGDTWEWEGNNWSQVTPAASPPPRSSHAVAYDAMRGQVVLFGGGGSPENLGDTWVWYGGPVTVTTQVTVTTSAPGLVVRLDGGDWGAPVVRQYWPLSVHEIGVRSTQQPTPYTRYNFMSWSDGGPIEHQIVVPFSAVTYTASYNTYHYLSRSVAPGSAGTFNTDPVFSDGFAPAGVTVQLTAAPYTGFAFSHWSGDVTGSTNPTNVVMSGPRSVTVNFACTWALTPPGPVSIAPAGATGQTVSLATGFGCLWTAASNAAWITVTAPPGGNGTGSGTVTYNVAANSGALRSGTITIAGQTFTVNQAGVVACSYGINPTNAPVAAAGGSGNVSVTASASDCAWTATSNNPTWLTVTSGTPGTGNGAAGYSVAANTGIARSGTITIAGQTFTVNQAAPPGGLPGVVSVSPASGNIASQAFTFAFSHTAGWQSLGVVNILVNFWLDGRNSCYLAYSRPANTLYLINNAGDGYAGSLLLNGSGTLGNSQCVISGAGSSVSGTGNTMNLTLNMTFPASFAGTKIIYAAARDSVENNSGWQRMGVWKVPGGSQTTTTAVAGMNPARGSGTGGTFTYTFTDTNGANDLGVMNVLVNDWLDGRHACYLAYARGNNTLYLMNDNGDALLPGKVLNGSGSLGNSQCTVNGVGSSATPSGNTLTLTLNMTFGAGFTGNRVFYVAARDVNELNNTGWQAMGTWTVQ